MSIANDPRTIRAMAEDPVAKEDARRLLLQMQKYRYPYNFSWLGRPIIQLPSDILAIQELIWRVKPQRVIETGIAHGGSLVLHASLLELVGGSGLVIGIDVELRQPNRRAIEEHPMGRRIRLIDGSSVDGAVVSEARRHVEGSDPVFVILDSMHTHEHVLRELHLYAPLVTPGSYVVVLDTVIEDLPEDAFRGRPWGKGNNPKTAVREFLRSTDRFEVDREIESRLLITAAPEGFLRRVRE